MRIATEYGKRLALKSQNLKPDTLKALAETYSSHSFVIDQHEAESLFENVRGANEAEQELVAALGRYARFEMARPADLVFEALSKDDEVPKEATDAKNQQGGSAAPDGRDSARADGAASPAPKRQRRRRSQSISDGNGRDRAAPDAGC
ncbi:MAG TPA: hypothetical protein VN663_22995 [Ramlibacter sp.]|nr:hypothetical protein [Ramlibacter sp.]